MSILCCKQCNRVKINEETPWSENPSQKIEINSDEVTVVEYCSYCNNDLSILTNNSSIQIKEFEGTFEEKGSKTHEALKSTKRLIGTAILMFASYLRDAKEKEYYKLYHETWKEYLADSDIGIDDSRARRLIQLINFKENIDKQIGDHVDIDDISEARLCRDLLPCVKINDQSGNIENIDDVIDLVDKAKTLGSRDWIEECKDYKSQNNVEGIMPEKLIPNGARIKNKEGTVVGVVIYTNANDEFHICKIRLDNDFINEEDIELHI